MFIHTETYGSGEPLVLIHGWAMHSGIWRIFAKQLAQQYQVTCVDLPGHGQSEKLPQFTLEAICQHLQNILPVTGCTLIGWSLGGMVALALPNRFPTRVKKIILIGSNPHFVQTADWVGMQKQTLEKFAANLTADCYGTLLRFLALQVHGLDKHKEILKELKVVLQACKMPDEDVLQGGLEILQQQDLRLLLKQLHCPVQVILGSHDTLVPVAVAEKILQLKPTIALTIIEKAAHVPFLSHPELLLKEIHDFMRTIHAV